MKMCRQLGGKANTANRSQRPRCWGMRTHSKAMCALYRNTHSTLAQSPAGIALMKYTTGGRHTPLGCSTAYLPARGRGCSLGTCSTASRGRRHTGRSTYRFHKTGSSCPAHSKSAGGWQHDKGSATDMKQQQLSTDSTAAAKTAMQPSSLTMPDGNSASTQMSSERATACMSGSTFHQGCWAGVWSTM